MRKSLLLKVFRKIKLWGMQNSELSSRLKSFNNFLDDLGKAQGKKMVLSVSSLSKICRLKKKMAAVPYFKQNLQQSSLPKLRCDLDD